MYSNTRIDDELLLLLLLSKNFFFLSVRSFDFAPTGRNFTFRNIPARVISERFSISTRPEMVWVGEGKASGRLSTVFRRPSSFFVVACVSAMKNDSFGSRARFQICFFLLSLFLSLGKN